MSKHLIINNLTFLVFIIPQRYVLGLMGFLAIVNAYTMRVSLSVAITEMVLPSNTTQKYDPDSCPGDDSFNSSTVTVISTQNAFQKLKFWF